MFVQLEKKERVAIVTLNRPPVNALGAEVLAEINATFKEIDEDKDVRVVVLTGSGKKFFVAGADIGEFVGLDDVTSRPMTKRFQDTYKMISHFRCPVIAAINGLTLGGGNELAMSCDIRIAADNASFGQPEVGLGLIPGGGGTQRLPRLIPTGKAKLMIFNALNLNAAEAEQCGLVDMVVPADELMDAVMKIAVKISRQAPIAVAQAKKAVDFGLGMTVDNGIDYELEMSTVCFGTEDIIEGVGAFNEKRHPDFKNK